MSDPIIKLDAIEKHFGNIIGRNLLYIVQKGNIFQLRR